MKLKILIIIILTLILATSVYSQVVDRPVPPIIHTWTFTPSEVNSELPYYPAACDDKATCGVVCYYVNEGEGQYELSCLPVIFE